MATGPRYEVPMRRRHEVRTDYYQRLRLLKSGKPHLVARVSNRHVRAQLVTPGPQGDETHTITTSADLDKYDWEAPTGNLPGTYFAEHLAGKRTLATGVEKAVPDTDLNTATPENKVLAVWKGTVDAGLEIPHNDTVFTDWDHNRDVHITECVEQFDELLYSGESDATNLPDHLDEVLGNFQEGE